MEGKAYADMIRDGADTDSDDESWVDLSSLDMNPVMEITFHVAVRRHLICERSACSVWLLGGRELGWCDKEVVVCWKGGYPE